MESNQIQFFTGGPSPPKTQDLKARRLTDWAGAEGRVGQRIEDAALESSPLPTFSAFWEALQPLEGAARATEMVRLRLGLNPAQDGYESESESRSVVSDSATLWTIQFMEFSRPEYWNVGSLSFL